MKTKWQSGCGALKAFVPPHDQVYQRLAPIAASASIERVRFAPARPVRLRLPARHQVALRRPAPDVRRMYTLRTRVARLTVMIGTKGSGGKRKTTTSSLP